MGLTGLLWGAGCGGGDGDTTIQGTDVVVDSEVNTLGDPGVVADPGVTTDLGAKPDPGVVDVSLDEQGGQDVQTSDVQATCPALDACQADHCTTVTDPIAFQICLLEQCRTDYEACFGSFGTDTCEHAYLCAQACPLGGDACAQNCILGTTYDSSMAFLYLTGCMRDHCATQLASGKVISLQQCILASCKTEYEGCNGTFGAENCKTLLKCQQACDSNSGECSIDCMVASSYDANVQFTDLGVCMENIVPMRSKTQWRT